MTEDERFDELDFLVEMSEQITLKDEVRAEILHELEEGEYLDAYMDGEEGVARDSVTPEFAFMCNVVNTIKEERSESAHETIKALHQVIKLYLK